MYPMPSILDLFFGGFTGFKTGDFKDVIRKSEKLLRKTIDDQPRFQDV